MRRPLRLLLAAAVAVLAGAVPAAAEPTDRPWPPLTGDGTLFVHFGEEHWNDEDGETILPRVVDVAARYRPALVTTSGDKANDGTHEQLGRWEEIMAALDRARVPYLGAVGNHDRTATAGQQPGVQGLFYATAPNSLAVYGEVFADRPWPMGDARPYPGFSPAERPADDPDGAASRFYADVGGARWIFIDNSCWYIQRCDPHVRRSDADERPQLEWLLARSLEAQAKGLASFVVMHMPTRDPRDQSYTDTTARQHVMGKDTLTTENDDFERVAEAAGVDGVFVGHIKGQFLYRGRGDVPYFIDGGAGGELYTTGPVGTDHGYWHGLRLLRVAGGRIVRTDAVPVFVDGGLTLTGPDRLARGATGRWEGFGRQPVFHDPAKVERLELRDPDPVRPPRSEAGGLAGLATHGGVVLGPVLVLLVALLVARLRRRVPGRLAPAGAAIALALVGAGTVAMAQRTAPTTTPRSALPSPARIFTSSDPRVLVAIGTAHDDPRRDRATQTEDGAFRARCPGTATVSLTSGFETTRRTVTVPSEPGRLVRRISRGARTLRRGARARVATVRLAQPAVIRVRVRRGGRTVATLRHGCAQEGGVLRANWRPARGARRGTYTVEVRVLSDRRPVVRRFAVRVR